MRNLKKLLFVTGLITAPYLMAMYGEESDFSDDGSMALIASPTPAFAPPACMMGLTCTEHEIQIDMRPAQHNQMKADDDSWSLTSNDAISWSSGDEEEDIQNNNNARNDNSARCASNSDSDLGSTIAMLSTVRLTSSPLEMPNPAIHPLALPEENENE